MKKIYEKARIEIVQFECEDIMNNVSAVFSGFTINDAESSTGLNWVSKNF